MSGIAAGELNQQVIILERRDASGKVGAAAPTWVEKARAWASVKPAKYLKAAIYKAVAIEGNVEITMRRKDWFTAKHCVVVDGKTFSVVDVATDKREGSTAALLKTVDKLDGWNG